ncbi:MAG: MurR/RpiR family transcriptional regulator [Bacillota bacterium]
MMDENRAPKGYEGVSLIKEEIIARLQKNFPQFTRSQRHIADYLLAHPDRVAFLTASRLGRELSVSESTVVRFAVALGYSGYPEMQKDVQEIIRNKLSTAERMKLSVGDKNILAKIIRTDMQNLQLTLEEISQEEFNRAVSAIHQARRIYVAGLRSAASLAHFLGFYLDLVLKNTTVLKDMETMLEDLITLNEKDLVIGISFHRYTRRVVEFLCGARERGAKVIALTDSVLSPLAQNADITLLARSDINSFIDSFVAPLSIINALIVAVSEKDREGVLNTLSELEDVWKKLGVYYNNV